MFVVYQSGTILHDDGDGELLSVKGSPTRQVVWGHTHAGRDPDSRYSISCGVMSNDIYYTSLVMIADNMKTLWNKRGKTTITSSNLLYAMTAVKSLAILCQALQGNHMCYRKNKIKLR